ncbi:MAG: hypothetical protein M3541_19510 [Acidobacteriota bacterium]|nr:hypothetical protein [Acidobacteriota bacterium]MDQ3420927.1 hypothetical protein [Acidobacteriota bacterium]
MTPAGEQAMLAELRAIRRLLEANRQQPAPSRADRAALTRVLPVLAATFGSEIWTAGEALSHSSIDLRIVLDGVSAKRLGRLLRRAIGQDVDGLTVASEGTESGARLWCIKRTS